MPALFGAQVSAEALALWQDNADLPTGVIRYVPNGVLRQWTAAFTAECQAYLADRSRLRALQLVRMPRLIFAPCARGGKKHHRQVNQVLERRLHMWTSGQRLELLREIKEEAVKHRQKRPGRKPAEEDDCGLPRSARRAVLRALREGALSKASKILLAWDCGTLGPEADDGLRKLHPAADPPVLPEAPAPDIEDFEAADIARALKSFPPGSGAGPSGLMAAHLPHDSGAETADLHVALAALCSEFARGKLPADQRDLFCGARLIALSKKPAGVRPIAIGETLRRLAAKCLVARYQAAAVEYLAPLQLGVGIPGATECIIHRVKEWMHSGVPADHALVLLDFSNAFNTLDRSAMLRAIALRCPHFLPYARFCYEQPTPLFRASGHIESRKGTQQGDVCGPLFFAVTLQAVALEVANTPGTTLASYYLDDGAQAGSLSSLASAVSKLEPAAAAVGLKLNRAKCKLWGPGPLSPDDIPSELRGIPWVSWTAGVKVLGTPVGRASFVRSELSAVADKLQVALEKLECLGDPQAASHILRSCLGAAKVVHLLRTASYAECHSFAKRVRSLLQHAWAFVLGTPLPDASWSLLSLPVRLGGFGATDPVVIHPQAAVASFLSCAAPTSYLPLSRLDPELLSALDALAAAVPEMAVPLLNQWHAGSLDGLVDSAQEFWSSQKSWTAAVHEAVAKSFDREATNRLERLRNLGSGAYGGSWITNLPLEHDGSTTFTAEEFQVLARFRLGLPFAASASCGGCGARQDIFGDHALSCHACGTYARHNRLRDTLAEEYNRVGIPTRLEGPVPEGGFRIDVVAEESSETFPQVVDVSVVHPLHPTSSQAEVTPGTAAAQREQAKHSSEAAKECAKHKWRFTAVAVETTGCWGPEAQKCIRGLARKQSMRLGLDLPTVSKQLWRRLSGAVAKGVARMLLRAFGAGEAVPAPQ